MRTLKRGFSQPGDAQKCYSAIITFTPLSVSIFTVSGEMWLSVMI
jgi:hypothetical protein